ncbi:hypothetical protein J3R83DRAFT_9124 [Lanmaoa asiatica]|nr:hypothetical protein J3R83DRAFT_9124 [Lanmaoa asiatica]
MNTQRHELLDLLTIHELLQHVHGMFDVSHSARSSKLSLLDFMLQNTPAETLDKLESLGCEKKDRKEEHQIQKRKFSHNFHRSVRRQMNTSNDSDEEACFLKVPPVEQVHACNQKFYRATCHEALLHTVCGVCGRECGVFDEKMSLHSLDFIPLFHIWHTTYSMGCCWNLQEYYRQNMETAFKFVHCV